MRRHSLLQARSILLGLVFTTGVSAQEFTSPPEPELGEAIEWLLDDTQETRMRAVSGGFAYIDVTSREQVREFYNAVYLSSEQTAMGWTGNVATCTPGTTSDAYRDAVLRRINWYRAMAGVPANITFNADDLAACQEAAMMFSRNGALSHSPPTTWACYEPAGANAAGSSNISLGNSGWDAISSQMKDNASNNQRVGHRRWILYPQTLSMATGDIPANGPYREANCLQVVGSALPNRPSTRESYVAWPPPGYFPNPITPIRWSLSVDDADFTVATVTLRDAAGVTIPIVVDHRSTFGGSSVGENTIVWYPSSMNPNEFLAEWPDENGDTTYQVSVSNVDLDGQLVSYDYSVTIFDPTQPGADAVTVNLNGPTNLTTDVSANFTHEEVAYATGYQLRRTRLSPLSGEDAETTDDVIVSYDGSYEVLNGAVVDSGFFSFHLAHPSGTPVNDHVVELDRTILPGAQANLSFRSRLRWAAPTQLALVQVSTDEGVGWTTRYSQGGTDNSGESSFHTRQVSLTDYAGQAIRIRFVYRRAGTYFFGSDNQLGWFIDTIALTDMQEMTEPVIYDLPIGGTFSWSSDEEGTFAMDLRAIAWDNFPLSWGPVSNVTAGSSLPAINIGFSTSDPSALMLQTDIPDSVPSSSIRLQRTFDLQEAWTDEPLANYSVEVENGVYRIVLTRRTAETKFLRLALD